MALAAAITGAHWGLPGVPVVLSGETSTPGDTPIHTYSWSISGTILSGKVVEPILAVGTYAVTLTVRDGSGASDTSSSWTVQVVATSTITNFTAPYGYDTSGAVINHSPDWVLTTGLPDTSGNPHQIFSKDGTDKVTLLQLYVNASFTHKFYVYQVDDRDGRIDGLLPMDNQTLYRSKVTARRRDIWPYGNTAGASNVVDGFVPGAFYAFLLTVPDIWDLYSDARINLDFVPHSLLYRSTTPSSQQLELSWEDWQGAFDSYPGEPLSYDDAAFLIDGFGTTEVPALRLFQRGDSRGASPSPRLTVGNHGASEQSTSVRRLGGRNTFL